MTDTSDSDGRHDVDLTWFEELATSRRTSLRVDPDRAVPRELIDRLCRLAVWAPNHRKTWPWRFALFTGDGRARLGTTIASALEAQGVDDALRLEKARTKYLRAPAVIVVGADTGDTEFMATENRDAAAAGVQNLLLGATAAGLASFWASALPEVDRPVGRLCLFDETVHPVAIVYLGWPIGDVPTPTRPEPGIALIDR